MKIFLTHAYYLSSDKNELRIMMPYAPLGMLYVSSFLKSSGLDAEVYDSTFGTFDEQKDAILKSKPDVIGLYCNLMTKLNVIPLIRFIRSAPSLSRSKIVLGGPDPPFYASEFLDAGADIIVVGEGEVTMKELCIELGLPVPELKKVNGIIFRDGDGNLVRTAAREQIKDIDIIPLPDRQAINLHLYLDSWKKAHGFSSISINTMRGCPYTCKWCSHSVYGAAYRRRSPEKVADEVELLVEKYSPDRFWFVDDVFTMSQKWLFDFDRELKKKNLNIRYECITRSDRMNEEVVRALKDSGCYRVWIGAESGSQKVIDLMDRRVNVKQVREMIKLARENGIETGTFIMLGYPGETKEDIHKTVEHLKLSAPDHFLTTTAYPIKGTPFYDEVESSLIFNKPWEERTDRDLDFRGRYSKRFYRFANRYIVNEVNLHKMRMGNTGGKMDLAITYIKAKVSRVTMSILN